LPVLSYGYPKLIAQINIHYLDGTESIIGTDESWKESMGPICENGIYYGEKYDARCEMPGWDSPNFNDGTWNKAILVAGYPLASQMMQPIEVTKIMRPQKMFRPQFGKYIYDFGQNFTGFVRLYVRGPNGTQIKLRFAELLNEDGTLNTAPNVGALATDIYILKGEGLETFEPHFTYHGFRYVELTGFPGVPTLENIEGLFFHSNVPKASEFNCSNQLINQIHHNVIWSQLSNLMSIPTDCPQRDERHGWMGDAQLVTEEAMLNFDMARFYSKYLRDIKLSQQGNGSIPDIVPPYWGIYPADPAWGSAFITIAWYMYWYYNDIRILEEYYDALKNYIDFLISSSEGDISVHGRYGDWCPPMNIGSKKTPLHLVSTWYYYHDTLMLSRIAKILGKENDFTLYLKKADEIKNAFNSKFLLTEKLSETVTVNEYEHLQVSKLSDRAISQTSNALPLYLKMVPEDKEKAIFTTLIEGIKSSYAYHIDTGIVGTRYIFDVLKIYGYPEIAYKMITQTSYPGYGYMIKEGATTLWERWEKLDSSGMNSYNHIMLGSVDTWFYNTLLGVKCLNSGWSSFQIKPFIPDDMNYASASLKTIRGLIYCAWEKTNLNLKLTFSIPVGCEVEIWIPLLHDVNTIKEGDSIILEKQNPIETDSGIKFNRLQENYAIFNIGSGYYQFIASKSKILGQI
jgi:alpha-L-rhamnosidase